MITVDEILAILGLYTLFGFLFMMAISFITDSEGLEFVNPVWLYKKYKVNWFGAMALTIVITVFVFPYALAYWFYKLCTVGRK